MCSLPLSLRDSKGSDLENNLDFSASLLCGHSVRRLVQLCSDFTLFHLDPRACNDDFQRRQVKEQKELYSPFSLASTTRLTRAGQGDYAGNIWSK